MPFRDRPPPFAKGARGSSNRRGAGMPPLHPPGRGFCGPRPRERTKTVFRLRAVPVPGRRLDGPRRGAKPPPPSPPAAPRQAPAPLRGGGAGGGRGARQGDECGKVG
eukprot:gene19583-biopygen973